jgi:hypothetical protein
MPRFKDGRTYVNVNANKTLTAADSGIIQRVVADGVTITLPATADGLEFRFMNGGLGDGINRPAGAGANKSVGFTVHPQSTDGVTGGVTGTPTVNKGLVNTKATSIVEDELALVGNGTAGVTAWGVSLIKGIWAREA